MELLEKYKAARDYCIIRFYAFIINFWEVVNTDEYIDNWHIEYIADFLQEQWFKYMSGDEIHTNVIINIPPGMSKSTIISQMFPVWIWLHFPKAVIITTSYAPSLANDNSIKSKDIFRSEKFQIFFQEYYKTRFGKYIYLTKDTEMDWRNNFGGVRYATAGGVLTGKHAHIIFRDDPMSVEQAASKTKREKIHRFNDKTLPSRKKNKERTPIYTIMQCLHEDDTTGHEMKKDKKIYRICMPCKVSKYVNPPELKDKYINGFLDPVRLNQKVLDEQKADLGSYAFSGQYEQTPYPEEGGKIKKEWFNYCKEVELPRNLTWDMWVDGAYTKDTANDPTGLMICAYSESLNRLFIRHGVCDWMEMPELLKFVPEYLANNGRSRNTKIWIEPKASGLSLKQLLNKLTKLSAINITGHLVAEGKEARLQVASPKIESGRITLVEGSWTEDFVKQICGFPNLEHDEFVDLIGYAVEEYFNGDFRIKRKN